MIETDRLLIRSFKASDYLDLYEYLSNPDVYRFEPGDPVTLAEAQELALERSTGDEFYAVVLKASGKMIGHLYLGQIEPKEHLSWELGYIFNPSFHRQGYASEATRALVKYAFEHYQAHRILARCDPENPASWKLLERIGFRREGHFRQCGFFRRDQDGKPIWHDAYEYAILREQGALK